jgi:hypothetical protein
MNADQIDREAARRVILEELAKEPDGRRDAAAIHLILRHLHAFRKPIEWVIDQLAWLQSMGAVVIRHPAPEQTIAEITAYGQQFVDREVQITGVAPMPRREL